MKKHILSIITICLLIIPTIIMHFINFPDILPTEKRRITNFNEVRSELNKFHIKKAFSIFKNYYIDHLFFREYFLNISNFLNHEIFHSDINPNKCYRGKNNWLFLGNDYDKCVDALTGKFIPTNSFRKKQLLFYNNIYSGLKNDNIDFYMIIGSNKSTIYKENLPPTVIPSNMRIADSLIHLLIKSNINIFDSKDILIKNKNRGLLFYRSDTHWNALGAEIVFRTFLKEYNFNALPIVDFSQGELHNGDLVRIGAYKKFPISYGDNFKPSWHDKSTQPIYNKTILVLGDSFSDALMFYIQRLYKNVYREHYAKVIKNCTNPYADIKNFIDSKNIKPDIVLWVQVERIFNIYAGSN